MQTASRATFRTDFNDAHPFVRVVSLVSPTCLVCQYGEGVVRTLFETSGDEQQLRGFMVWIPMMDADDQAAAGSQADRFEDARVRHLWDGEKELGEAFARTLGLKRTAWDVYLLYAPGIIWDGEGPPTPTFWMHQLPTATGADHTALLHAGAFGTQISRMLGRNPNELPPDMALYLHAKGISAIRGDVNRPSVDEMAAAAVGRPGGGPGERPGPASGG